MRFISPDSASPFAIGGLNSYAYCGAQPVTRKDPSGQWFLAIFAKFSSAASSGAQRASRALSSGKAGKAATTLIGTGGVLEFMRRRMPVLADAIDPPPINWVRRGFVPDGVRLMDQPVTPDVVARGFRGAETRQAIIQVAPFAPDLLRIESATVRVTSVWEFAMANRPISLAGRA